MNKCKGCQWYGKPYWSIINPCDNCPRENTNIEIITRWQDPTIEEYQKEIERLNNIIDDKKERQDIAIRLLNKIFGTNDYEINYIIGILNGQRQIHFKELKEK